MYAHTALQPNPLLRNGAYGIVMLYQIRHGNSLLDEFMWHKLITENDALKNVSAGYQETFDDQKFFRSINDLIDLQKRLYD